MGSITIHNLDPEIRALLDQEAAAQGMSLNQLVKRLLRKALGLPGGTAMPRRGFDEFAGLWTKEEASEYLAATERKVDPEDWRSRTA